MRKKITAGRKRGKKQRGKGGKKRGKEGKLGIRICVVTFMFELIEIAKKKTRPVERRRKGGKD